MKNYSFTLKEAYEHVEDRSKIIKVIMDKLEKNEKDYFIWMETPNAYLNNCKPQDKLSQGLLKDVLEALNTEFQDEKR
jgi:hypothetical protein